MVSLYLWWASLAQDVAGRTFVKPLQIPSMNELERLPDEALFVLRAILQLHPADKQDIMESTRLDHKQINGILRYGQANGFIEEVNGLYSVSWKWFRAITQQLQRRHLLVE